MITKTLKELVYFFRPEHQARPIFLLGAGASFKAGVPLAKDMVNLIGRYSYSLTELGVEPDHATKIMEGDIRQYLKAQSWYKEDQPGEMFPYAVEKLLAPSSVRKAFFHSMMTRATGPSSGHNALASLFQRQLVQTVLTTNFDHFIEDALKSRSPHIKEVVGVNRSGGDIAAFTPHNQAQVVYLHGAFEYYRDRNTIDETKRLDEDLVRKVRPMISYAPLVVMGYRGYEPSVMDHLIGEGIKDSNRYAHGIFWCARNPNDLHENVVKLAEAIGNNFILVTITGFDEALVELNGLLEGRAAYQSGSAIATAAPQVRTIDSEICPDLSVADLEPDQLIAMAKQYAEEILKVELKPEELERFLEAYSFAKRDSQGVLRPTLGLYLLTGKDVTDRRPHLKATFLRDGKQRIVFNGNLLKQFVDLRGFLLSEELNQPVRIKRPEGAVEMRPYNERAVIELLVNLMAHRDYGSTEFSLIEYTSGKRMSFLAPGGLPDGVHRKVEPKPDGGFLPQRNVREIRNPVISDVFFSQGHMDKAGTGLVDVIKYMQEHYGSAEFSVGERNEFMRATLIQAEAGEDAIGRTAIPVTQREVYLTNLLPFGSLPTRLFSLPLDKTFTGKDVKFFEQGVDDPARQLVFVRHGGAMWSFADLRQWEAFSRRVGYPEYQAETPIAKVLEDPDRRRIFVQLLGRHWERLLRSKSDARFFVDYKSRSAYFLAKENGEDNVITYDSPMRRNIARAVVKRRETATRFWYENEGIYYQIVQFGNQWAVQIKPFYVFTREDGRTPLPGTEQTRRATRRYKFDRNKAVESDMKFWSIFLSGGRPTVDLGAPAVSDLVMEANYLEAEALDL